MYVHVHVYLKYILSVKFTLCTDTVYMYVHVHACTSHRTHVIAQYFVSRPSGQESISFAEFLELMGEVLTETTRWGSLSTKLDGYVGFDTIQEQIRKKSIKRGFEFNLMVVGKCALCVLCVCVCVCVCVCTCVHLSVHLLCMCICPTCLPVCTVWLCSDYAFTCDDYLMFENM